MVPVPIICTLSDADEEYRIESIEYEADPLSDGTTLQFYSSGSNCGGSTVGLSSKISSPCGQLYYPSTSLSIKAEKASKKGTHSLTIKSITVAGLKSGQFRMVEGLPATFQYVVE